MMDAAEFPAQGLATTGFGYALGAKRQVAAPALKYRAIAASYLKHYTISSGGGVKNVLHFDLATPPTLAAGLRSGLSAYATNVPKVGPPATLWLRLCDGQIIRVGIKMHDLSGWDEIGTLAFESVHAADAPDMVNLPASWKHVRDVQMLVHSSDACEAECGLVLNTSSGDQLVVLPGADVYTLAIKAPFHSQPFTPENDLAAYERRPFRGQH
jgi:hypothetical protein